MAETTKKASTSRTPRKAAAPKAAPEKTAQSKAEPKKAAAKKAEPKAIAAKPAKATKTVKAPKAKATVTPISISHDQIAQLAHRYWAERGRQHGHHEEDWYRAERELLGRAS